MCCQGAVGILPGIEVELPDACTNAQEQLRGMPCDDDREPWLKLNMSEIAHCMQGISVSNAPISSLWGFL